jgi:hypothetical protein
MIISGTFIIVKFKWVRRGFHSRIRDRKFLNSTMRG